MARFGENQIPQEVPTMSDAMKYRKKPVVIEAMLFDGTNGWDVRKWCGASTYLLGDVFEISTLEGVMTGQIGDYIIKGVQGEFYPCKPDIFEQTYEPAPNPTGGTDHE
jgi:hypothetical protein